MVSTLYMTSSGNSSLPTCQVRTTLDLLMVKNFNSRFLYFPAPGPCPWPPIFIYRPWPPIFIYRPRPPICVYRPWPQVCVYRPYPTVSSPVRDLSLHIPTLSRQLVFVFKTLVQDFYYWSGAWIYIYLIITSKSTGSSNCSSSSNFFGIDNTNISMPILVN